MVTITVNGVQHKVQAPDDTPLLYVLRNDLQLRGPQFGCGLAQCGACAVLIEGKEVRSCVTPLSDVAPNQEIITLEGLPARWAKRKTRFTLCSKPGSRSRLLSVDFARTE